jgi:hypothetical protein
MTGHNGEQTMTTLAYNPENQLHLNLDISIIVNDLFDYERVLFREHYLNGRTFKEIAKIAGLSEQGVKRAIQRMRREWLIPQLRGQYGDRRKNEAAPDRNLCGPRNRKIPTA